MRIRSLDDVFFAECNIKEFTSFMLAMLASSIFWVWQRGGGLRIFVVLFDTNSVSEDVFLAWCTLEGFCIVRNGHVAQYFLV